MHDSRLLFLRNLLRLTVHGVRIVDSLFDPSVSRFSAVPRVRVRRLVERKPSFSATW